MSHVPQFRPRPRAAQPGATKACHDAATIRAVGTILLGDGVENAALTILELIRKQIAALAPGVAALDACDLSAALETLERAIRKRLDELTANTKTAAGMAALRQRLAILRDFETGESRKHVRALTDTVAAFVTATHARIREALERDFEASPLAGPGIAEGLLARRSGTDLSAPAVSEAIDRCETKLRVLEEASQHRQLFPDPGSYAAAVRKLEREFSMACEGARDAIARRIACDAIADVAQRVEEDGEAIAERSRKVAQRFDEVRALYDARVKDIGERSAAIEASASVLVPDASQDEILAGLALGLGVSDDREIARHTLERFQPRLAALAALRHPTYRAGATFSWPLFLTVGVKDVSDALVDTIRANVRVGTTFLDRVRALGREQLVDEIARKVRPIVEPDERADPRFNVYVRTLRKVRIPAGDRELRALFESRGFEVEEVPETTTVIRAYCLKSELLIHLDRDATRLRGEYLAEHGGTKRPHLYDLHPRHPDGTVHDAVRRTLVSP